MHPCFTYFSIFPLLIRTLSVLLTSEIQQIPFFFCLCTFYWWSHEVPVFWITGTTSFSVSPLSYNTLSFFCNRRTTAQQSKVDFNSMRERTVGGVSGWLLGGDPGTDWIPESGVVDESLTGAAHWPGAGTRVDRESFWKPFANEDDAIQVDRVIEYFSHQRPNFRIRRRRMAVVLNDVRQRRHRRWVQLRRSRAARVATMLNEYYKPSNTTPK